MIGEGNVVENVNWEGVASTIFETDLTPELIIPPIGAQLVVFSTRLQVSQSCFSILFIKLKQNTLAGSNNRFRKVVVIGCNSIQGSDNKFEDCRFGQVTDGGTNTVLSASVKVPKWLAILPK